MCCDYCDCGDLVILSALGTIIAGAIAFLTAGYVLDLYPRMDMLLAIPLCAVDPDLYIGGTGDICEGTGKLSFNLTKGDWIPGHRYDQTAWLVHNLYGLDVSLSIRGSSTEYEGITFSYERNMKYDGPFTYGSQSLRMDELLPDVFTEWGRYRVWCPNGPTLGTDELGVSAVCAELPGYPAKFTGSYEMLEIGDINYDDLEDEIKLNFDKLQVRPTNFYETPEIYFVTWKRSSLVVGLRATGIVCASLVGIATVVVVILALFC